MKYKNPYIITFNKIGNPRQGYISISENWKEIPFNVERVFWTYFTPHNIIRGKHAHYKTEQILIAVNGIIKVEIEYGSGKKEEFILDSPEKGLYIPPHVWHTMRYSHSAVQMVLASTKYEEIDYIRDYNKFKEYYSD